MQSGDTFAHTGGRIYSVLDKSGPDTLISYETKHGTFYAVVWQLHEYKNRLYEWDQGHYFHENIEAATRFMKERSATRERENRSTFIQQR